jgi:hypothetical protein
LAGNFNLEDYITVNERIAEFYEENPDGSIQTEIISNQDGQVIIKAYTYRNQDDKRPCTGHAMEKADSTYINKTSHIENCETSAVGRALAMMGYEIKKSVASREEVANARLNQDKPNKDATKYNKSEYHPKTTPHNPPQVSQPTKETEHPPVPAKVNWSGFWANAVKLGFKRDEVHKVAGVESITGWTQDQVDQLTAQLKLLAAERQGA